MDVVWDQDVRNILCGIISAEPKAEDDSAMGDQIKRAVKYADLLQRVREVKSGNPVVQHHTRGRYGGR